MSDVRLRVQFIETAVEVGWFIRTSIVVTVAADRKIIGLGAVGERIRA